jgi:hypothetical protein
VMERMGGMEATDGTEAMERMDDTQQ